MNFVVLSSSRGTTFQAVIDCMRNGSLTATCLGLISDREDRGCVEKAKAAGLPMKIVEKREEESREQYDTRVHAAISDLVENGSLGRLGRKTESARERPAMPRRRSMMQ